MMKEKNKVLIREDLDNLLKEITKGYSLRFNTHQHTPKKLSALASLP